MKIEAGKYYRTRDGRKVGPMEETDNGDPGGFRVDRLGLYRKDGTFGFGSACYCRELDIIVEWVDEQTGTLAELNVKPGDVVEWFNTSVVNPMEVISASIITSGAFEGQVEAVLSGYGYGIFDVEQFRIISRASNTPKTWGEMTDAEKGASATMEAIEYIDEVFDSNLAQRVRDELGIKPEPKRETVTMHWAYEKGGKDGYAHPHNRNATHRITFTTTDGNPDLDSIKMEALV